MSTTPSPKAPRRADHLRNQTALLKAARAVFAEQGADASIGEVVRRAGFAKGTFFRHFATKEVLVQALLADRLTKLGEIASEVNTGSEPGWSTLCLMMERILDHIADDRSLAEFMDRGDPIQTTAQIKSARQALADELDRAVRGAQAMGEVRPDVTASDFPAIMFMITRATARHYTSHPRLGRRYLRLFLDGIRSANTSDLGEPPLTRAEMELTQHCPPAPAADK
ncbi:MAG: TetR/AcrR family transcriptional regulator [Solirubrobacteraceae bacterium]